MNIEYEIIGNTIPFDKSAEMYNRSTYIGPADDGWSEKDYKNMKGMYICAK